MFRTTVEHKRKDTTQSPTYAVHGTCRTAASRAHTPNNGCKLYDFMCALGGRLHPEQLDDRVRPLSRHHMPRFATVILVIFLTCFSWVAEAARFGGRGGKIVQPRVRPIMAGGVGVKPPPSMGSAKKKVVEKPKVIRIPFSPFEYDMAQLHSTDLAFDMFWRSTPLL